MCMCKYFIPSPYVPMINYAAKRLQRSASKSQPSFTRLHRPPERAIGRSELSCSARAKSALSRLIFARHRTRSVAIEYDLQFKTTARCGLVRCTAQRSRAAATKGASCSPNCPKRFPQFRNEDVGRPADRRDVVSAFFYAQN